MATPETVDFDRLLTPLPGDRPTGENLREDRASVYYELRDARISASRQERTVDADAAKLNSAWRAVAQSAIEIIATRSKDLDVATFLSEALLRVHGFPGLRDGFRLLRELCERFWDDFYPPFAGEDGLSDRLAVLAQLNGKDQEGTLIPPIRKVLLTQGVQPIAYWDYQKYTDTQSETERQKGRAKMKKAVEETNLNFFRELREDLDQCIDEFGRLCQLVRQKCAGHGVPSDKIPDILPSSRIADILSNCRNAVRILSKEGNREEADKVVEPMPANADMRQRASTALNSREEALRTLLTVADYFRHTEPHSPLSYLLEQAVRWGHMPLPELIGELIADEKARQSFCRLTGIRTDSK